MGFVREEYDLEEIENSSEGMTGKNLTAETILEANEAPLEFLEREETVEEDSQRVG